jgi:hypothetical protein
MKGIAILSPELDQGSGVIGIGDASTTKRGFMQVGTGLSVSAGVISMTSPASSYFATTSGNNVFTGTNADSVYTISPGNIFTLELNLYNGMFQVINLAYSYTTLGVGINIPGTGYSSNVAGRVCYLLFVQPAGGGKTLPSTFSDFSSSINWKFNNTFSVSTASNAQTLIRIVGNLVTNLGAFF